MRRKLTSFISILLAISLTFNSVAVAAVNDNVDLVVTPAELEKPSITTYTFPYDGQEHSIGYAPPGGVIKTGDSGKATEVGTYRTFFEPDGNHVWTDGTREKIEVDLVIEQTTAVVTPPIAKTLVYNGTSQTLVNAGTTSFGTMEYRLGASGAYSTSLPSAKDAGTYTVYYKAPGVESSVTVTIAQKEISLIWGTTSWAYDGNTHSTTCTAGGLASGDTCVVTLSNNSIKDVGSVTVSVSGLSNANYKLPAGTTTVLTVTKANSSVTAPTAKTLTYNGNNQELVNGGSSTTGTIQYKLGADGTYSANIPAAKNAGTYDVYYKVIGDINHNDSAEAKVSVTIAQKTAELSWGTLTWNYDGSEHSTTCTVSNAASGDTCTVTLSGNSIKDVGTKTVTAASLSNSNYKLPAANTATLTVNKTAGSVTAPSAKTLTYNGSNQTLISAGSSTTGTIQYKLGADGTYGTTLPAATNADNYDVYYKVVGDANHSDVAEAKISVTIAPKGVGLTWGTTSWTYDGNEHSTTCTVTGLIGSDSCTATLSGNSIKDVGTKTVTATSLSNSNYKLPAANTTTLTVSKASGSVTAPTAKTLTYNGSAQALINAGSSTTGTIQYKLSSGTYGTAVPTATSAGTYDVYYKVVGDANHSDVAEAKITVTIGKKEVGLSWGTTSWVYDGKTHQTTCTATGTVGSDTCTVTLGNNSIKDVGSKTVTASGLSNGNYKLPSANTATLTVTSAAGSVTAPTAKTLTYNGSNQTLINAGSSATGTIQYKLSGGTYGASLPQAKTAGTYTVYYKVIGNAGYSDVPEASITVTIAQKEAVLSWGATSWTYDGNEHSTTCTVSNVATGDTCTVTLNGNSIKDVGTKTVTAASLSNSNYKLPAANTATLTVNKTAGSVTAPTAKTLTYNGSAQALVDAGSSSTGTIQYKLSGGTYSTAVPTATNADTYDVYYKVVGDANHDDVAEAKITVTIGKKEVGLSWGTTSWVYDGSEHKTTCTATGIVGSDSCTVTLSNNSIKNVGSVTVTASALSNNNYKLPSANTASLTVTSADGSMTPPTAKTLTYNGSNQTLIDAGSSTTGTMQYKLGSGGTYGTGLPAAKDAGTYTVYYKVVANAGYNDIPEASLTVTIGKKEVGLSWGTTSWTYDGSTHQTTCTATETVSGDTCTVTLDGNSIKDVGSKTVTASGLSNSNYKLPSANTATLTVTSAAGSVTAPTAKTLTYNGSNQTLINAGSSATGTIQYKLGSDGTYGTSLPQAKAAGTYTVYYKVVGSAGYNDVPEASLTVTIGKKEATLLWGTTSWTYDGDEHSTTCTVSNVETGDTCTVTLSGNSIKDVGSKTVTATSLSNSNYKLPAANTATLTVTSAAGSVTAPSAKTLTYNGGNQTLINAGSSATGTIQYKLGSDGTYGTSLPQAKAAGTYTVYYKVVADAGYNDVPEASLTVTIGKKEAALSWGTTSWTYDGNEHSTTCTVSNVETGDTCTVTLVDNSITNIGSVTVTASALSNDNYKLPAANTTTLTVEGEVYDITYMDGGIDASDAEYALLEYIESDGSTAYLDTGVIISDNSQNWEIDFELSEDNDTSVGGYQDTSPENNKYILGAEDSKKMNGLGRRDQWMGNTAKNIGVFQMNNYAPFAVLDSGRHLVAITGNSVTKTVKIDGETAGTVTSATGGGYAGYSYYVGASNSKGPAANFSAVKVYEVTFTGSGTVHLVPARRNSDGKLGMYDTESEEFIAGIGSWSAGSVTGAVGEGSEGTGTIGTEGGSEFSGVHESGYPTTHTYGIETTLKSASKDGYIFGGWFAESDCSGTALTALGATDYTDDITLYAKWEAEVPEYELPTGYVALEYLSGNGTKYIDTGVNPNNPRIEAKIGNYASNSATSSAYAFGIYDTTHNFAAYRKNGYGYAIGSNKTETTVIPSGTAVLNMTTSKLQCDGEDIATATGTYTKGSDNIYLFAASRNGSPYELGRLKSLDMYYCQIWDGNTLVRDLIPAKRSSDGTEGMIDKLTGTFYPMVGQAVTYTITYSGGFGVTGVTNLPNAQTKTQGVALTLSISVPTRTNYTFTGWNTNQYGTGTTYQPGSNFTTDANTTLYAVWTQNVTTYTITYDGNGSTYVSGITGVPASQTKTKGVALTLSSTVPTCSEFVFAGWNTKNDGSGTMYQPGSIFTTDANTTLYAIWGWNITYKANGGTWSTGGSADKTQSKIYGVSVTLDPGATLTRSGYTFAGWNTNATGTGTNYSEGGTYTGNDYLTLYAKWTAGGSSSGTQYLTATADGTGSASLVFTIEGTNKPSTYIIGATEDVSSTATMGTAPKVVADVFSDGTNNKVTLVSGSNFIGQTTGVSTSMSGNKLTVTVSNCVFQSGVTYKLEYCTGTPTVTTKSGTASSGASSITFNGFTAEPDVFVLNCQSTSNVSMTGTGQYRHLYVVFHKGDTHGYGILAGNSAGKYNDSTVYTYSYNNGSLTITAARYNNSTTYIHQGSGVTQELMCWNGGESGSGTGGTTQTYTITYNAGSGVTGVSVPAAQTKTKGTTLKLSATVPTRSGYAFTGWNTNQYGTGTTYQPGSNFTTDADTTLYAMWTQTYTITFNANGGQWGWFDTTDKTLTKTKGVALALSPNNGTNPTRDGYTFAGWNTNNNGTGQNYNAGANYTTDASTTLYAKWTPNTYTITFNKQSGSGGSNSATATYGAAMPSATMPTRSGFTFSGYYTGTNGSGTKYYNVDGSSAKNFDLTANTTLYAYWTAEPDYLKFTAQASTAIAFEKAYPSQTLDYTPVLQYRKNGGTWTDYTIGTEISLTTGQTLEFRGDNERVSDWDEDGFTLAYTFTSTGNVSASGNAMTLLDSTGSQNYVPEGALAWIFSGCKDKLKSASGVRLPATTLAGHCYESMFNQCTGLTSAPSLPATTLADYCYCGMFYGCTNLTTAPSLPATTLANGCYYNMFGGCTSLTTAPSLPATTLADYCYGCMFSGCTGIKTAPSLPATRLTDRCYYFMFEGCTSLTTAPSLPATTLADYCYCGMFYGCTNLTTAPSLPATTLADNCYGRMFYGCTSLTTVPELPATTLSYSCYEEMFFGCTSLTSAPSLPATTLPSWCYKRMFSGCTGIKLSTTRTGIYQKAYRIPASGTGTAGADSLYQMFESTGGSFKGTPSINTTYYCEPDYFTITAVENTTIKFNGPGYSMDPESGFAPSIQYSTDGGASWKSYTFTYYCGETPTEISLAAGKSCMFRGDNETFNPPIGLLGYNGYAWTLASTGKINASGNVMTLIDKTGKKDSVPMYCFSSLFNDCTTLISASNLSLPATTLGFGCYSSMFQGCNSLTSTPSLPATTLVEHCYNSMFQNCTSLPSAPNLPATILADGCYHYMFGGCESLKIAPELPAKTLAYGCYNSMFSNCTSLTSAPSLPATTLTESCYEGMFSYCKGLTSAPKLPATTLAYGCYRDMFRDCTRLATAPSLPATILATDCYNSMFWGCTSLTTAPSLQATTLAAGCYECMFYGCTSLTSAPNLPATTLAGSCYERMFYGCTGIKLSKTYTYPYTKSYKIPTSGTGTMGTDSLTDMFKGTGGTFTGTPSINTTYYQP